MAEASISDAQKAEVRSTVFNHLSGIVMAPTVKALADRKVFDLFAGPATEITLDEIVAQTRGNRGYVRAALRLLAACGWVKQTASDNGKKLSYSLTREGEIATSIAPPLYAEVVPFIPKAVYLEDFLFGASAAAGLSSLSELVSRSRERWGMAAAQDEVTTEVHEQLRAHLDGALIGPSMVALARGGVLGGAEACPPIYLTNGCRIAGYAAPTPVRFCYGSLQARSHRNLTAVEFAAPN